MVRVRQGSNGVVSASKENYKREQTFPSVSFDRCRCVSVKCVERVLSVLELQGRARCVAPRASADAASAA